MDNKRKRIEIEHEINDEYINIECDSTLFARKHKVSKIDPDELMKDYLGLVKTARENNKFKIIYKNGTKRKIKELADEYLQAYSTYEKAFDDLKQHAEMVVEKGIYYGYSDDKYMSELNEKEWKIERMFRMSDVMMVYKGLQRKLKDTIDWYHDNKNDADLVELKVYL